MQLTPHEQERLLIHVSADVAEKRRARGLKLSHPEAVALLSLGGIDDRVETWSTLFMLRNQALNRKLAQYFKIRGGNDLLPKAFATRLVEKAVLPGFVSGDLSVPVAATFPLDEVAAAYDRFKAGGKLGKVVLEVQ